MKIRKENSICERIGVKPDRPNPESNIGLAIESLGNGVLHGLRHPAEKNTNGWYIWAGNYKENEDFFSPVCIKHLSSFIEIDLSEFLDLPEGYRFLVDGYNYEDVWFDDRLLNV
jgi:hypothetical protein